MQETRFAERHALNLSCVRTLGFSQARNKQWHHCHLWERLAATTFAITLKSRWRGRDGTEKVTTKVSFPSLVCTLKRLKSVLRKEKKNRGVVLLSPAIDSVSVKKHNRVKSVLKSGEDLRGLALFPFFFHRCNLKDILCPSCVPNTHSEACLLFMQQTEAGKGMWSWTKINLCLLSCIQHFLNLH